MTSRPDHHIEAATAAHVRLLGTVDQITDAVARRPSRLPGWTVGHVVTHLARNADSLSRILEGAARGEHLEQYAGGAEARNAAIEAGADRTAADLREDLHRSIDRLEVLWTEASDEVWSGYGLHGGVEWPCTKLPSARWREVEIHHVDLGLDYAPADWADDFVDYQLNRTLADLPERLTAADQRAWLAWVLGRSGPPDLDQLAAWQREQRTSGEATT